jgi:hypothetical protein
VGASESGLYDENIENLFLTNSTTITYSRYTASADQTQSHLTYVVSFKDSVSVQRAITNCTSTTTTSVTITSIDQNESISHISSFMQYLAGASIAALQFNLIMFSTSFASNTSLTLTRATDAAPQDANVSWEIIEWLNKKSVYLFY